MVCGALFRPLKVTNKKKTEPAQNSVRSKLSRDKVGDNNTTNGAASLLSFEARMNADNGQDSVPGPHEDPQLAKNLSMSAHCLQTTSTLPRPQPLKRHGSDLWVSSVRHRHQGEAPESPHVGPMSRKDIFYSGSLMNIPMYRSNPALYTKSITSLNKISQRDESQKKSCCQCSDEVKDSFKVFHTLYYLKAYSHCIFGLVLTVCSYRVEPSLEQVMCGSQ